MSRSAPPAARPAASLALAGACAFAVGSGVAVLALLAAWAVDVVGWLVAAGFGLGGAVGGYLLERTRGQPARWLGALGLGLGFPAFGVVVSFSVVSLQGGADPAYGAASWGIALGVAGAVAGPFLAGGRSGLPALAARTAVAAAALAVAGIAGGAATFAAAAVADHPATVLAGLSFTWAVAGTLLAGAIGWLDRRSEGAGQVLVRPAGFGERAAWTAAACALLGLLLAVLFPLRLRLPGGLFDGGMAVLGVRGAAGQAAALLAPLGLAALTLGGLSLGHAGLRGRQRAAAVAGLLAGGLLVASSLALVATPAGRSFEAAQARALLASVADMPGHWNYGNVVHRANVTLGRVALARGDRARAVEHLLAAGRTPGSPQLDTFGPDLGLADELVAAGDRTAVAEYLRLCRRFWQRQELLDRWLRELEAGETPDFGHHARRR